MRQSLLILPLMVTLLVEGGPALGLPSPGGDGARCYRATQPDAVISYCTQAIAAGKLSVKALASAFYRRANAYNHKLEVDRAIDDYNEAIRLNPQHTEAFSNRGVAFARKGEYDRAIRDYDEAIRLNPEHADAFSNRGVAYARKRDYDRAIQDYDEAIRLSPNHTGALYARGNAYRRKGDYHEAVRNYDEVIRLNPGHVQAYANRGVAYASNGDDDRAIRDYDEAVRLNPRHVNAHYNRGNAYRRKGDYDEALRNYDQVIRLNPKHGNGYSGRGMVRFYQGQFAAAAFDFAQAGQLAPGNLYLALLHYVAEARAGNPAQTMLAEATRSLDLESWPGPIVSMFLGRLTEHAAIGAAKGSDRAETQCQAYFYAGQQLLIRRNKKHAADMFRQAVATNASTLFEYEAARAELDRLEK